jgi:hypothetical protein
MLEKSGKSHSYCFVNVSEELIKIIHIWNILNLNIPGMDVPMVRQPVLLFYYQFLYVMLCIILKLILEIVLVL